MTVPQWTLVGLVLLPIALEFIEAWMRPDLFEPFLDHLFGYLAVGLTSLVELLYVAVTVFGFRQINRRFPHGTKGRTWRMVLVSAVAVVFFEIPALFSVLFAPIAFAFMFGHVENGP